MTTKKTPFIYTIYFLDATMKSSSATWTCATNTLDLGSLRMDRSAFHPESLGEESRDSDGGGVT